MDADNSRRNKFYDEKKNVSIHVGIIFSLLGSVPEIHTDSSRRKNIQGDMSGDTFIIRVRYRNFEHSCLRWTHDDVDDLL